MNLSQNLEAYLFHTGEAHPTKKLAGVFGVSVAEVESALSELDAALAGRGIMLVRNGDEVMLATRPEAGELILSVRKQELSDPLSKAALETLALVLYRNGATKPEIDFIRGVNSQSMLRNLLVRGLVEKVPNEDDRRITKYRATFDTLRHLGVGDVSELPDFASFASELERRAEAEPVPEENVFGS